MFRRRAECSSIGIPWAEFASTTMRLSNEHRASFNYSIPWKGLGTSFSRNSLLPPAANGLVPHQVGASALPPRRRQNLSSRDWSLSKWKVYWRSEGELQGRFRQARKAMIAPSQLYPRFGFPQIWASRFWKKTPTLVLETLKSE